MIETATEKSGPTAGEKNTSSSRERRRNELMMTEVHQLQPIDRTVGILVPTQRQTPVQLTELRTIRWWRRDSDRSFRRSRIPQAQSMPSCHTMKLEICPSSRKWSSHRSSTLSVSSTEWLICPRSCLHGPDSAETPLRCHRSAMCKTRQLKSNDRWQCFRKSGGPRRSHRCSTVPEVSLGATD